MEAVAKENNAASDVVSSVTSPYEENAVSQLEPISQSANVGEMNSVPLHSNLSEMVGFDYIAYFLNFLHSCSLFWQSVFF